MNIPSLFPKMYNVPVKKLNKFFAHTSTSYKYLWALAILDVLEKGGIRELSVIDIISRMLAIGDFYIHYEGYTLGKNDGIPKWIDRLNMVRIQEQDKETIIDQYESGLRPRHMVEDKPITYASRQLLANVPYRFLSPWIPYTSDIDVKLRSQKIKGDCPHAIFSSASGAITHITFNPKWEEYLACNRASLRKEIVVLLYKYLRSKSSGLDIGMAAEPLLIWALVLAGMMA